MKKETLIRMLSEEFDNQELSYIVEVMTKAIIFTDKRYKKVTKEYDAEFEFVMDNLASMKSITEDMEKENKDKVRIVHDNKRLNKKEKGNGNED